MASGRVKVEFDLAPLLNEIVPFPIPFASKDSINFHEGRAKSPTWKTLEKPQCLGVTFVNFCKENLTIELIYFVFSVRDSF